MSDAAIECDHVRKVYKQSGWGKEKQVEALRGVSLSVSYGDIIGLIGPNGAGKTTLMNLITGVTHPTGGRIMVGGCAAGSKGAKRLLGYMPESPAFLETYSVEAELHYHGALCHLEKKSRTERIEELLDQLGLRSMRARRCGRLSHGMRQRLALAIALIMKPRIIILDEPGSALDPVGVVQLREMVVSLARSGTAVLISSHRLHELEKVTSTFVGIWDGQVVDLDAYASSGEQTVKIEIECQVENLMELVADWDVVRACGTELTVRLDSQKEILAVLSRFVERGIPLKSLQCNEESIEEVFLRISLQKGAHS